MKAVETANKDGNFHRAQFLEALPVNVEGLTIAEKPIGPPTTIGGNQGKASHPLTRGCQTRAKGKGEKKGKDKGKGKKGAEKGKGKG